MGRKKKRVRRANTFSTLLIHELRGPEGDDHADPESVLEGPWPLEYTNQSSGKVSIFHFSRLDRGSTAVAPLAALSQKNDLQ